MFVGRRHELDLIRQRLDDRGKAQLVVLYGRRRVGKSRLIREALANERRVLYFEGIQGEQTPVQIGRFLSDLAEQTGRVPLAATSWSDALRGLGEVVGQGRWVVVLDELPWLSAGRTRLVSELKLHWDRWSKNPELVLFLCGSIASFMTKHVVHSRALHNRKTLELCLGPLPPREAGEFIGRRGAREKAQLYMCLGGVPKYLEQIDPRHSLEKNLNRLCFTAGGFFVDEFETLFKEQFRSLRVYESIVASLARAPHNMAELAREVGVARGGGFAGQLDNLVRAQFVHEYRPVGPARRRTRTVQYRLVDPFLIFYFRFIHSNRSLIARNWDENLFRAIVGPHEEQYFGYAFERLFEDAFDDVRRKLGLALADIVAMGPFFQRGRGIGLQIDWLVLRRDDTWTLFELKYSNSPSGMDVVHEVSQKIVRLGVPDSVSIEKVLVSAAGATRGVAASGFFDHILTLPDLVT